MKIKLTVYDTPDKEFLTIDPAPMDGPAYTGDVLKLDGVCEPAECTYLLADSFLDYIPFTSIEAAVSSWCKLIRHGGTIVLGGTNANELSRLWITKSISAAILNEAIYGKPIKKAGLYSIEQIEKLLVDNGIKITRKALSGTHFVIEGVRP